ncbi:hypothetical protein BDQ94DRAFT_132091 [Aspergillus welwitschiae]|nr:hypothetical protein BDQ94DRAFT_132091 [Aspergillus welwitschiae]RDH38963.1 hypothetical protein BDQ94DRAFT_132091 [Aspergillus welwitschiae]
MNRIRRATADFANKQKIVADEESRQHALKLGNKMNQKVVDPVYYSKVWYHLLSHGTMVPPPLAGKRLKVMVLIS